MAATVEEYNAGKKSLVISRIDIKDVDDRCEAIPTGTPGKLKLSPEFDVLKAAAVGYESG